MFPHYIPSGTLREILSAFDEGDAPQAPALSFADDEAGAARRAATARVLTPLRERKTVVVRQLFARHDVPAGDDPDPAAAHIDAAIGRTQVIDESRDVPTLAAVKIVAVIEDKDVDRSIAAAA